ncbi:MULTISPECIES: hypothetical protein [Vitreoscilla]|uniref:Uncharacterized protein n=1 Tax=Vitreoscilla stercoraria TaxID=61 RepID=A0ABY4E6G7_VITST|nr:MULTISPECIES: hypothetical protein [Vitreoscilla]AUZ04988.2 hypothetical protein ADP71_13720 [Vitreoscilla sp. C1]UOO91374.1 hypothetical protein LVJ81_06755 [Vitreoscilla stercoraria]
MARHTTKPDIAIYSGSKPAIRINHLKKEATRLNPIKLMNQMAMSQKKGFI